MGLQPDEFYKCEFSKVRDKFSRAVYECFGNLSAYSYLSGTFAYGGARKKKSDIDVTIVFKNSIYKLSKDDFINKLKKFIKIYRNIHKEYNYYSDNTFPGEYVTLCQVDDAINGRGFSVDIFKHLYLPLASNKYYLKNREHWFRAWLSSTAFSIPITKKGALMSSNKIKAWQTIILFMLTSKKTNKINVNSIFKFFVNNSNKWKGMGVTNRYIFFKQMEIKHVENALEFLRLKGFLVVQDGLYKKVTHNVHRWEKKIVESILSGKVKRSLFLIDEKDVQILSK